jgi:dipeptidyl aminopeptidase/acylaminoacyl peptidase
MKKKQLFIAVLLAASLFGVLYLGHSRYAGFHPMRHEAGERAQAGSKAPLDQVIDLLFAVNETTEVSISPNGAQVAWVEMGTRIYVEDLRAPSAAPRRVSAGGGTEDCSEHDVAWSPDGRRLAFLSDAHSGGQLQIYVAEASGGAARQLTHLTGFLTKPAWSPDGKILAVLFTENAPRAAGPLQAEVPDTGVVEEHIYEQRLTTVDVTSGALRQVSPPELYVYEYDWSPHGKSFVATAAHGSGDDNWYTAELYNIDAAGGEIKSIFKPPLQIAKPRWSPDGRRIAFIEGLMSDEGSTGGDIYVMPAGGGEPQDVTPHLKASPSWLAWLPSSNQILFTEFVMGSTALATADLQNGEITTLWSGPETISGGGWGSDPSLAKDGKNLALVRESFERPPDVWAGPAGGWKQVTHVNGGLHPRWGQARSVSWHNDGWDVQGWLLYPENYNPAWRYPMVVEVHGGPGAATTPAWPGRFSYTAALPSQGYFVFFPNPRGSFGEGEAFVQANVKDFGYGDFRDILTGVDQVVKMLPIDNDRVGITGWSYGGYMTMWAVTQTQRFRAAVAGAGIANWQSYYGENRIDRWMIPFFGASVYDDAAVYAKSSPITFIKNVHTPTLILVGDSDGECPPPQSYEFWHALTTLGVKTQMVIYPHEGHMIANSEHQRDIIRRAVEWFNAYLH